MTGWMVKAVLYAATVPLLVFPCPAQRNNYRPMQGRPPAQVQRPHHGHAGDWLRRYHDLPPAEREHMLQNDPGFRRLPPERQQLIAATAAAFLQFASAAAGAGDQPDGNLGTFDSRAESRGSRFVWPDAATSARATKHG